MPSRLPESSADVSSTEPNRPSASSFHLWAPPVFFVLFLFAPLPSVPYEVRVALGLMVWMAWWWITEAVHLAVTGLLPLVVTAIFAIAPMNRVLPSYAAETIILLLGANILASVWTKWGLDRRIALVSLLAVGTGTSGQILAWFLISAGLSAILPNTIVAVTMIPIVVTMLRFIGIEDLSKSRLGTALVLAVAWGTSAGGAASPLGGAPNLLTVSFIQDTVTNQEFLFMTWVTRLLPITLVIVLVMFLFMRFAMRPEIKTIPGSRDHFRGELRGLGPMGSAERWGLALFLGAVFLAFGRALFVKAIPGLTPAYGFLAMAMLTFLVRPAGKPLMTWPYAQKNMMWGLFYLFAGGIALGRILDTSGAGQFIADALVPYAGAGGFGAVVVFITLTMVLTQISSNTAAAAIMVPITISTFQSLGMNPIPYVYLVAVTTNCGFILPSSSGGPAVAAGYGINLKTMAVKGLQASLLVLTVIILLGYLMVRFWPAFSIA